MKSNKKNYDKYIDIFLQENAKVNLISKNDEKVLFEKHIQDSLGIRNFFEKYYSDKFPATLLDIGTGGGFPAIPIALKYPQIQVYAIDSIHKKISAVNSIKEKLNIKNLTTICDRVENINRKFDIVTSRAVSALDKICQYALPHVEKNGYFVAYKSQNVINEIEKSSNILKKNKAEIIDIIEYALPLQENFNRNLVIILKH